MSHKEAIGDLTVILVHGCTGIDQGLIKGKSTISHEQIRKVPPQLETNASSIHRSRIIKELTVVYQGGIVSSVIPAL